MNVNILPEQSVEREIRGILEARREFLHGHRVILFGSRARGSADRLSDFDIGVDGAEPLDLQTFYEIEATLDQMPTLYRVDWVDLNRASAKLRENARREGRVLYEA